MLRLIALALGSVLLVSAVVPAPSAGRIRVPGASTAGVPAVAQAAGALAAPAAAPIVRSVDLVTYQSSRRGAWFSVPVADLPSTSRRAEATFPVRSTAVANRRSGRVSPTLVASYVFLQFGDVPTATFEEHAQTLDALFIRTGRIFVDYEHDRVLDWDGRAGRIAMDVRGFIRSCNSRHIPVFLQLNYTDWVPGPDGSGVDALVRADTLAGMIRYLDALAAEGLQVDGVTFGDEWGDDAGFGARKPTFLNSDIVGRFITYATALKTRFPTLKVYAFDSYIAAARGEIDQFWEALLRVRRAETSAGRTLLDGFTFRESYVYMDPSGRRQSSQRILDDTESLYRNTPVYRYDSLGRSYPDPDRDYLHTLVTKTRAIFGRSIDLGLTEYLPAIPTQLGETDTSKYADIDFVLHYADVVGIYGELGFDVVSSFMFANSPQQHESYIDRSGNQGLNYPVREQLAALMSGTMLNVVRSVTYERLKVKIYAVRDGTRQFVVILNKDAGKEHTIRITLPGRHDLTLRLPRRSYTSLTIDASGLIVSGVGS